mmetsp:Transcript_88777/g.237530  ORF Transcript_88777/g.237530 Transcript_88777/m.237530 type:complete len:219 (-) Transcript_88777:3268-3924(-)
MLPRPIRRQLRVQLAGQYVHNLRPHRGVHSLEGQVVIRGQGRDIQGLPGSDQHLHGEEHVPQVGRQAAQEHHGQVLLRHRHEPVVVVLDVGRVLPQRQHRLPGPRRHLLPEQDLLQLVHGGIHERDRSVPQRIASPLDRRREHVRGNVGQQVVYNGQQHVRGQVRPVLILLQREVLRRAPPALAANLLVTDLPGHGHEGDGSLEGGLDLLEHLHNLLR